MLSKKGKVLELWFLLPIIILLIIVGYLLYERNSFNKDTNNNNINIDTLVTSDIVIDILFDERCLDCNIETVVTELRQIPFLRGSKFNMLEYTSDNLGEYMLNNNIKFLPAIIFNKNNIDNELDTYLDNLPNGKYSLNVGASFDPFESRSDKGFLLLEQNKIKGITDGLYKQGNIDSDIIWIEYTDIECPYCAKFNNSGIKQRVNGIFDNNIALATTHFPLDFHPNAMAAANVLECVGREKGSEGFYYLLNKTFEYYNNNNFDWEGFKGFALETGIDDNNLNNCISKKEFFGNIAQIQLIGVSEFGIRGTPGNVLLNTKTGEYQVYRGSYPEEFFIDTIKKMLE